MKKLALPTIDDAAVWKAVATGRPVLKIRTQQVQTRYSAYHVANGDLRSFHPQPWATPLLDPLAKLYKQPPQVLDYLGKLREPEKSVACSMCGGMGIWSLDHVLAKSEFPEFYLYSRNLVPACPCNSRRGADYSGTAPDERLLHPYYDTILCRRLVRMRIKPPYPAPKLSVLICMRKGKLAAAVRFHARSTLMKNEVVSLWTGLWSNLLRDPLNGLILSRRTSYSDRDVLDAAERLVGHYDSTTGTPNNWHSMFFFGISKTPSAIKFLRDQLNLAAENGFNPLL